MTSEHQNIERIYIRYPDTLETDNRLNEKRFFRRHLSFDENFPIVQSTQMEFTHLLPHKSRIFENQPGYRPNTHDTRLPSEELRKLLLLLL